MARLKGELSVPSDKSITHRAIFLSSLASGTSTIRNPLEAGDCFSSLRCVENLGCRVKKTKGLWSLEGKGLWGLKEPRGPLDCGNSGTTMRLLAGILSAQDFSSELGGDDSLSHRPMDRVAQPLRKMGCEIDLREGLYPPVRINGSKKLQAIRWKSRIASAQVKSAVLLAGLHVDGETLYQEPFLSRDHTERMLKASGVSLLAKGNDICLRGPASLAPRNWVIPGDFSSSAYFIVGALLTEGSRVTLKEINLNPTRTGLLDVLKEMGCSIGIENKRDVQGEPVGNIVVEGRQRLRPVSLEVSIVPRLIDEIPLLFLLATQAEGRSRFKGIEELRVKETDRIAAMSDNLKVLGGNIEERGEVIDVEGPVSLRGGTVQSYGDHRLAMTMAIASLVAEGETVITGKNCVSISYPEFWMTLARLTK